MSRQSDLLIKLPNLTIIHQKEYGTQMQTHSHVDHEFFIPLQGEIGLNFSNKKLICGVGKLLYIPAGLDHSFFSTSSRQGERMILLLNNKKWSKSTNLEFNSLVMPLNSLVRELAFYILLNPNSSRVKIFTLALFESLIENLTIHKDLNIDDYSRLEAKINDERIKSALRKILSKEKYTVTQLAKECGLSTRNLNRLFLLETGATPKNMMIMSKINQAKELLLTTKLTITDISLEVGYNSLSKFISIFHKYTGQLPMEYRKSSKREV